MHFLRRLVVAALVASALAACSGQSTFPSAGAQSIALKPASAPRYANAHCDLELGWWFRGACQFARMLSSGNNVTLKAYRGLTLTLGFGKSDATRTLFLFGDGTSSVDITGRVGGKTFPDYQSLPCTTLKFQPTSCVGKGFLYAFVGNSTLRKTVTYGSFPTVTITTAGTFPGTEKCAVNLMFLTSNSGVTVPSGWLVLATAKPKGSTVTIPVPLKNFAFQPTGVIIFAFSCE